MIDIDNEPAYPVPAKVLGGLIELREHGKANVGGVEIDLAPAVHDPRVWSTAGLFGPSWWPDSQPSLQFPWTKPSASSSQKGSTRVLKGDKVKATEFTELASGRGFFHPADKTSRHLNLVIERKNSVIAIPDSLILYRRGSFLSGGIRFPAILSRTLMALGWDHLWLENSDPPVGYSVEDVLPGPEILKPEALKRRRAEKIDSSELSFAELAVEAARDAEHASDWLLDLMRTFAKCRVSEIPNEITTEIHALLNHAAVFGYCQAVSEFAPHKRTVEAALAKLQNSIEARQRKAGIWHEKGLRVATSLQTRRPSASKSDLARHVVKELRPDHELSDSAVLKQVNRWIVQGDLTGPAKKTGSSK